MPYNFSQLFEINEKKNYFVPKKGVRGAISQKGGIGILQDILQFGAFRIPIYVALSESMELDFDFVQNCATDRRNTAGSVLRAQ